MTVLWRFQSFDCLYTIYTVALLLLLERERNRTDAQPFPPLGHSSNLTVERVSVPPPAAPHLLKESNIFVCGIDFTLGA